MNTKPPGETNTLDRLRSRLENFRTRLTDMEALANCANHTLERLPYMPLVGRAASPGQPGPDPEARRNYGRLQSLVAANAQAATELLDECNRIIDCAYDEDDDEGGPDDEGGSGPDAPDDDDDNDGGGGESGPDTRGGAPVNGHPGPGRGGALMRSRGGIALDIRLAP